MRTFEITIPPERGEDVTMILQVQASSWLDAMRAGLDLLHEETGLDLEQPGFERQLVGVRVRDVETGAVYGVGSYGQLSSGSSDEEPKSRRRPRRDTAPMGVMPPREQERPSSPAARDARAIVRSPGMQRSEEPRAIQGLETIPTAEAVGGVGATRIDENAVPEELARIGRPIVRSRGLKRRVRSASTRPMAAPKAPEQQTFRPVNELEGQEPTPAQALRNAVQMAYDHIPCRAAQVLLRDEQRVIRVEAARGDRTEQLEGAVVELPRKLEALWLDGLPYILGDLDVLVTYRMGDGQALPSTIGSALWVPLVIEQTPVGVLLVLDSRHRKGFTPGELKGATYLARTVAEQLDRAVR